MWDGQTSPGSSNNKAFQVHLQGSVLGSDILVFPLPKPKSGSGQKLINYLTEWTNKCMCVGSERDMAKG